MSRCDKKRGETKRNALVANLPGRFVFLPVEKYQRYGKLLNFIIPER
jgi:hypothetical protein